MWTWPSFFQNRLQIGRSNLVDPAEWPKSGLLNRDFGSISSVFPRKNSKTQSSQKIFFSPDPGNLLNLIFRKFTKSDFSGLALIRRVLIFVPSWDFPDFSGIFRICLGMVRGFSRLVLFPLPRPITSTYEEQSRKDPRHNPDLSRKKWETPRFGNPPVWILPRSMLWTLKTPSARIMEINVSSCSISEDSSPTGPAALKILRVVNLPRVVNLLLHCQGLKSAERKVQRKMRK